MNNLVVFLQTNKHTGCVCNPAKTPGQVIDLIKEAPRSQFPISVLRYGRPNVAITIGWDERIDECGALFDAMSALSGLNKTGEQNG